MANIQVTHDLSPNNARSESSIAINPNNPQMVVAGSKKFTNPVTYEFTLATEYSVDGGLTWHDSAPLALPGWAGISDPALTWDDTGNVYLVALPFLPKLNIVGIAVYKSTDGGQNWSGPQLIHSSPSDDKQWAAADNSPASPYKGRVYAVWDSAGTMRFARTLDGATWIGTGANPAGSALVGGFAPDIDVAADGTVYVVSGAGTTINMIASTDGGDSFHAVTSPATGITQLAAPLLPILDGWPVFPGGTFRVLTLPTAYAGPGKTVVVAWADYREGSSRIYYALSIDGGLSWLTGPSGQPLITTTVPANMQHFHPQVVIGPSGVIGCAFYEFGPKPAKYLIDVLLAQSVGTGFGFEYVTVTDEPWDPTVDAPHADGLPNATFIGDYFGLDASAKGFYPLWTDTRTGVQELFTDIVRFARYVRFKTYDVVAQILVGIVNDAPGLEIVGGHLRHVPGGPGDPAADILFGIASYRIASLISDREGLTLQRAAMTLVSRLAERDVKRLTELNARDTKTQVSPAAQTRVGRGH